MFFPLVEIGILIKKIRIFYVTTFSPNTKPQRKANKFKT